MRTQKKFYGWRLLAVLMYVFFATMAAPYFGAGVVNAAMAIQLGFNRSTLGLGFAALVLFSGLPAPLVAWTMSRCGARITMTIGATVVAMGSALMTFAVRDRLSFILIFGVLIGTGVAFSAAIPAQATLAQWFSRKRALALSLLWLSVGAGGAIIAPGLGKVVGSLGWRTGWWTIAALALLTAIVVAVFVRNRPEDIGQVPDGGSNEMAHSALRSGTRTYRTTEVWTARQAAATSTFWIVTLCAIAYSLPVVVMFAHLTVHLRDLGFSPQAAAAGLGLVGGAQIAGKIAVGLLGDRVEPRFLWVAAMLAMAVALLLAARSGNEVYVYAFAILLGIGQGASLVVYPTLLGNYFGAGAFAGVAGLQASIVTPVISLGPYVAGVLYDRTGSYVPLFIAMAVLLVFTCGLIALTRPPRLDASDGTQAIGASVEPN